MEGIYCELPNPANIVPGIGFPPDKMLQGRLFSYGDAQRYRQGGIGLLAFNLAEHGTAHATGIGEGLEGPAALAAQALDPGPEMAAECIGRVGNACRGWECGPPLGRGWGVHHNGKMSCISEP